MAVEPKTSRKQMELDCQEYQECPGLDLIALDSAA